MINFYPRSNQYCSNSTIAINWISFINLHNFLAKLSIISPGSFLVINIGSCHCKQFALPSNAKACFFRYKILFIYCLTLFQASCRKSFSTFSLPIVACNFSMSCSLTPVFSTLVLNTLLP